MKLNFQSPEVARTVPGAEPVAGSRRASNARPTGRSALPGAWEAAHRRCCAQDPAVAFTLMELILAIGVTALVLVAINGVFFSAMRLRERTTEAVDAALPAQHALTMLRRDLEGAMAPATNGVFAGSFRAGLISSSGLNQPVDIEFYTTTGALRVNEPWGEVQRVTYELRLPADRSVPGKDLVRSVTRNVLATIAAPPADQRLIGGIERIEFSCYDGFQWRSYWDTTLGDTNLPSAVRVRLQLAGSGGPAEARFLEMVVPIQSQPRTIPALLTAGNN